MTSKGKLCSQKNKYLEEPSTTCRALKISRIIAVEKRNPEGTLRGGRGQKMGVWCITRCLLKLVLIDYFRESPHVRFPSAPNKSTLPIAACITMHLHAENRGDPSILFFVGRARWFIFKRETYDLHVIPENVIYWDTKQSCTQLQGC